MFVARSCSPQAEWCTRQQKRIRINGPIVRDQNLWDLNAHRSQGKEAATETSEEIAGTHDNAGGQGRVRCSLMERLGIRCPGQDAQPLPQSRSRDRRCNPLFRRVLCRKYL